MKKIDAEVLKRLTLKRERRRIKRIAKRKIVRKKNWARKKERGSKKKPIEIVIPEVLDLDANRGDLIKLIKDIRKALLNRCHFRIDHRNMKSISDEALLLLTAEIERCTTVKGIRLKAIYELFPRDDNVLKLLNKIGYWEYFNLGHYEEPIEVDKNEKIYLKIVGDTKVSGEKIGKLIKFFQTLISFDISAKDKFSDAMIEAAANTVEHAYTRNQKIETIKKWWLTASLNKHTNEISFVFYDQGLGVLNTLETSKKHIRLQRLFIGWIKEGLSKGGLLRRLLTTNLSSYKDERRGNGLISFKTFIDEVESGELTIYTDNVSYSAISDKIQDYDDNLDGTLITWRIKVNHGTNKCMFIKGESQNDQ
jgi:anti-sigma regulatory factor (Ser/Thr protein kinase)